MKLTFEQIVNYKKTHRWQTCAECASPVEHIWLHTKYYPELMTGYYRCSKHIPVSFMDGQHTYYKLNAKEMFVFTIN